MKRAAEVKQSVRCSEEPVAGDGSMCAAVSVTKRSPKLLAADGTMRGRGVTKKRPCKADKPSKKEERSEEEKKRSKKKKRAEEKRMEKIASKLEKQAAGDGFILKKEKRTKKHKGDEVMGETMADDNAAGGMTELRQELLDYLRTKKVMGLLATEAPLRLWANKMAGGLFDFDQRLKEEIAAEFQENREFDAHVLYQYRTNGYAYAEIIKETETEEEEENRRPNQQQNQVQEVVKYVSMEEQVKTELAEKSKKKKLVTHEINQAEMGPYLSEEVWSYVMSIGVFTFKDCTINEIEMICDPSTEDIRFASRRRRIENQANLLRQYRTNGHVVLQYEVTDDERDAEV